MDDHFRTAKFEKNIPVILALLGVWYNNFFGAQTHAILPYDQYLHRFAAYFQQGDMESNGKGVDRGGKRGGLPDRARHLGRTGDQRPARFLPAHPPGDQNDSLRFYRARPEPQSPGRPPRETDGEFFCPDRGAHDGKGGDEVREGTPGVEGMKDADIARLRPFKVFAGNRPTNSILVKKITPRSLGSLIAMYEHKIFVQGVIWNIFSFDQWGVELGKQLAGKILPELAGDGTVSTHDSSTNGLINAFKKMRK